jgi:hypothetical protein
MKTTLLKYFFPVAGLSLMLFSCEDPERGKNGPLSAPTLRFDSVGAVKAGQFTVYGNITNSGGLLVQGRGVLFSETAEVPGFKDQVKVATGDGAGIMTATLAGLKPRTTYRFRLFARNNADTSYSDVFSWFSAPALASLSAGTVADSTRWDSLVVASGLTANGGEQILDRGFVVSKVSNPFINTRQGEYNFISVDSDSSLNGYQATIRNLAKGTRYYIRPYARNRGGVGYGSQVSIRTAP